MTAARTKAPLEMTHRERLEALSGLLVGMFVAMLANTVVSNALPTIVRDLHGGESVYSWVVVASLLATTVSTPIWGKLADVYNKKLLVQLGLLIFVGGSALAGLAQSSGMLIAFRVLQGVGAGGLMALVQVVIASIIPPRERGRYSGYIGATFGLATLFGPLIGGVIVDTSWLGWRWCFYVGVPFAILALVLLQKTLHIPAIENAKAKIDYFGALLLTGGVSMILIWVSLGGHQFAWGSIWTPVLVVGGIALIALSVWIESRAENAVLPLHLFKQRTVVIATVGSAFVGVALFGATVFLSQYFQISRGMSPTVSGLATLPMIFGLVVASTVSGKLITKYGKWKNFLVVGGALLSAGMLLMGTMSRDSHYWLLSIYMVLMGAGTGMLMQNLVLAVQNTITLKEMGAGSSLVAFFRSLGGAIGVSSLGALVSHRVIVYIENGFKAAHIPMPTGGNESAIPNLATLPPAVRDIIERAYGNAMADAFLAAAPFAVLAFIAVLFIKEVPLRRTNDADSLVPQSDGVAAS